MSDPTAPFSSVPKLTLVAFEQLLDVYGADRTRWPLSARADAAQLLAVDAQARCLLAEAVALEDVLWRGLAAQGEFNDGRHRELTDRIMAARVGGPRLAIAAAPEQLSMPAATSSVINRARPSGDMWRGAALLAASLMIGIFAGQSQLGARAVPALESLSGVAVSVSAERMALADFYVEANDVD
jgi:hypothetical protein